MPITATAEPGVGSGVTTTEASRIAPLTIDEILTDIKFRDPNSLKKNIFFTLGGR
ncbi:MAG: hypothetical protein P0119_21765 [Nitrospira sp.]|nr:hypothetical protein [Nitrospira sp.]